MGKLTVVLQQAGLPAEEVEVASLEEASKKVVEWQAAKGLGASGLTSQHGIVREDGRFTARVSYNGKVHGTPAAKERTFKRLAAEIMGKK
jgi:hypothetical protein